MRFCVVVVYLGLSVLLQCGIAVGEPGRDWTVTLEAEAKGPGTTPAGVLVLGTTSGVIGLEGASGRMLWRIDDLHDPDAVALDVLPHSPYGLLRLTKGARGRRLDALSVSKKQVRSILGEPVLSDTESTLVIASEGRLVCYELGTGAIAWTSAELEAGPLPPSAPMQLSIDGRSIFTVDGAALYAVQARDGRLRWRDPEDGGKLRPGPGDLAARIPRDVGPRFSGLHAGRSRRVGYQWPGAGCDRQTNRRNRPENPGFQEAQRQGL